MDLRKLSDEELDRLLAEAKAAKKKPKLDAIDQARMDPTADMPWWQKGLAGAGKAFIDPIRGVGQMVGAVSREDVDEAKARDAALMDTGWGMAGNVAGNMIPALAMPASTVPRALMTGAALGAAQPVGTKDSRTMNTLMGGMFSAAVPAAVAGYKGFRALAEPVMAPKRAAARILEQFADDPQAMRLAAQNATELVPGSKPTLAQVAQQPGISTLERGAMNQPGPLQKGMADRIAEQNAARMSSLRSVARDDDAIDAAIAARRSASDPLYEAAKFVKVEADKELSGLLKRPSMQSAMARAEELAAENGEKIILKVPHAHGPKKAEQGLIDQFGRDLPKAPPPPETVSGKTLHYLKMALDDMVKPGPMSSIGENERRALQSTRAKLVGWMDDKIPDYAKARKVYAEKSQPINEMQFGQELERRITPALARVAGTADEPPRLLAESYARALADSGAAVKKATGKNLSLEQVMSPDARGKVFGVAKDLDRSSRAAGLGKPNGSPTAQFLTTSNLMRQIAGPLGLPSGAMEKTGAAIMATPVLGSALQWGAKGAEQRMQQELAEMLLNPATAAQAMEIINRTPGLLQKMGMKALPYLPAQLAAGGMFAAANGRQ